MNQDQHDGDDKFQFNLRSLFLLTFLCALAITLVRKFQLGGTVVLFAASAVSTWAMHKRSELGMRRFWFQAIWGVMMPLACLFTDPFVFTSVDFAGGGGNQFVSPAISRGCYAFMVCEMLLLCVSWFLTPKHVLWAALLSGSLLAGAVFAGSVAICLTPLAAVFSMLLVGLPGFTPWFTMFAYGSALQRSWRVAERLPNRSAVVYGLAWTGAAIPVAVGLGAFLSW